MKEQQSEPQAHKGDKMLNALISLLGVLITGTIAANFIFAAIKLDQNDDIS